VIVGAVDAAAGTGVAHSRTDVEGRFQLWVPPGADYSLRCSDPQGLVPRILVPSLSPPARGVSITLPDHDVRIRFAGGSSEVSVRAKLVGDDGATLALAVSEMGDAVLRSPSPGRWTIHAETAQGASGRWEGRLPGPRSIEIRLR
jgi:hypothetical protein